MIRLQQHETVTREATRILAATDLARTDPVLEHALLVAEALGGEVVIVHALSLGAEDPATQYAQAVAACEAAGNLGGRISRTSVLRFDDPQDLVTLSSQELAATLVVLGAGSPPGPIARGVLRTCSSPLWIARGEPRVERINDPSGHPAELTERLSRELGAPLVDEPPRPGDLLVLDTGDQPALSRLHDVRVALRRHSGPLLVLPA
jgi:nucleotide-binding universal stress UspA family protein